MSEELDSLQPLTLPVMQNTNQLISNNIINNQNK